MFLLSHRNENFNKLVREFCVCCFLRTESALSPEALWEIFSLTFHCQNMKEHVNSTFLFCALKVCPWRSIFDHFLRVCFCAYILNLLWNFVFWYLRLAQVMRVNGGSIFSLNKLLLTRSNLLRYRCRYWLAGLNRTKIKLCKAVNFSEKWLCSRN